MHTIYLSSNTEKKIFRWSGPLMTHIHLGNLDCTNEHFGLHILTFGLHKLVGLHA
jgi:hypothetical protein